MVSSTVSFMNSVFTKIYFNNTIIDLSNIHSINIENILFINTFIFGGIKIHQCTNKSTVIMNSIHFRNITLADYFLVFNSLETTFVINDLEFFSFTFSKSKNDNFLLKQKKYLRSHSN